MKQWVRAAGVRAAKTFAQALVAIIGASALVTDVDWVTALSGAGLAFVLSLLTSVAGLPELKAPKSN